MIDFKKLDEWSDDERRIHLPFSLGDEIYPATCITKESIVSAAHTGELKGIKNPFIKIEIKKTNN